MARPPHTPADDLARTAIEAVGSPDQTGLRLASDQALLAHGLDINVRPGIVLATDRNLDPEAAYALITAALRARGWTVTAERRPDTRTSWLALNGPDGVPSTLALVRQEHMRAPVIIQQVPVADLRDCLHVAQLAVIRRPTPENLIRLEAVLAAQLPQRPEVLAPRPPAPVPAERRDEATPGPMALERLEEQRQARAAALREEAITLARNLALADFLGLAVWQSPAREQDLIQLAQIGTALRLSADAAQRAADNQPEPVQPPISVAERARREEVLLQNRRGRGPAHGTTLR